MELSWANARVSHTRNFSTKKNRCCCIYPPKKGKDVEEGDTRGNAAIQNSWRILLLGGSLDPLVLFISCAPPPTVVDAEFSPVLSLFFIPSCGEMKRRKGKNKRTHQAALIIHHSFLFSLAGWSMLCGDRISRRPPA